MYMPPLPEVTEDAAGGEPEVPERVMMAEAGEGQRSCVPVAEREGVAVRVIK